MLAATAIAAGVVVVLALGGGWHTFLDTRSQLHPLWLTVVAGGAAAAILAYIVSYKGRVS